MDVLRGVGKIMSTLKNPYKYYFIYKTINLINKKCYVGFHATNEEYDEYFSSGIMLNNAIKNGWNDDELRKKRGKGGILKIKDNIIIKEYCSTRVAAKYENTTHVTIISNCNRRIKDKNGYEWFYRDDYEKNGKELESSFFI